MIFLLETDNLDSDFCKRAYDQIDIFFSDDKSSKLRNDTICGRLLLAFVLDRYYSFSDFAVEYTDEGKPYLKENELYFNISHSNKYVLLSVSTSEIGCDVQIFSAYNERVAKRFYHKNELDFLSLSCNKDKDFIKLWVLKESILKNTGKGISGGLDTFDFSPYILCNDFSAFGYHFNVFELSDAYIAVCSEEKMCELNIISTDQLFNFYK